MSLLTDVVTIAFKVVEVWAGAFALTYIAAVVMQESGRFRLRRRGRRAARAYELHVSGDVRERGTGAA